MNFPVKAHYKENPDGDTKSIALTEEQVRKALGLGQTDPIPEFWHQQPQIHGLVSGLTATTVEVIHVGHED
ncbi:MAG: hypothetical protein KF784_07795 [Fimbriimonadaceae bacterium]|nr:hypothetical protein [Fimbriimonadaceae bacterium]